MHIAIYSEVKVNDNTMLHTVNDIVESASVAKPEHWSYFWQKERHPETLSLTMFN